MSDLTNTEVVNEQRDSVIQSDDFGYDPAKIWYRQLQHLQTINGMYMGVQAKVTFEGTSYQDVFDKALIDLKKFADEGAGNFGWRSEGDHSKWGQFNVLELPNKHRYKVIDQTEEGDTGITLSIRADSENKPEGNYYFTGKGKYNIREIDIHGADMKDVDQVMEEIKAIVKITSEN